MFQSEGLACSPPVTSDPRCCACVSAEGSPWRQCEERCPTDHFLADQNDAASCPQNDTATTLSVTTRAANTTGGASRRALATDL